MPSFPWQPRAVGLFVVSLGSRPLCVHRREGLVAPPPGGPLELLQPASLAALGWLLCWLYPEAALSHRSRALQHWPLSASGGEGGEVLRPAQDWAQPPLVSPITPSSSPLTFRRSPSSCPGPACSPWGPELVCSAAWATLPQKGRGPTPRRAASSGPY